MGPVAHVATRGGASRLPSEGHRAFRLQGFCRSSRRPHVRRRPRCRVPSGIWEGCSTRLATTGAAGTRPTPGAAGPRRCAPRLALEAPTWRVPLCSSDGSTPGAAGVSCGLGARPRNGPAEPQEDEPLADESICLTTHVTLSIESMSMSQCVACWHATDWGTCRIPVVVI